MPEDTPPPPVVFTDGSCVGAVQLRPYVVLRDLHAQCQEEGKQRLAYALRLLCAHESADGLVAKLGHTQQPATTGSSD